MRQPASCIKCGSTKDLIRQKMSDSLICVECLTKSALRRATGKVVFNLKTFMPIDGKNGPNVNLYDEIKAGPKTSEWRDANRHWIQRLTKGFGSYEMIAMIPPQDELDCDTAIDLTMFLKPKMAWFIRGYPKGSLPRLEARITKLIYWANKNSMHQFEIQFTDVIEITESTQKVV
jgi:hypothetical protein